LSTQLDGKSSIESLNSSILTPQFGIGGLPSLVDQLEQDLKTFNTIFIVEFTDLEAHLLDEFDDIGLVLVDLGDEGQLDVGLLLVVLLLGLNDSEFELSNDLLEF